MKNIIEKHPSVVYLFGITLIVILAVIGVLIDAS